ncbi:MAG: tRNA uridine-5-carboxymethylaminomethyl(34) synthesis GTPase MnmE [Cardiobacteriaceae bacterium]|nr:tRNA uridine-5-carboxymethylaminomethyl(34) synthesis GTPase MnmE [Cardiobacteriaceae bacterium]
MHNQDTIAAIATPTGSGGVAVIRISGDKAKDIASRFSGLKKFTPRHCYFANFRDENGEIIDQGLLIYFAAPNSFTGEDTVELQGHGGRGVAQLLLRQCFIYGARAAEGGEFSKRAFLNGKIDLAQAEAIADLINAESAAAVRAANRSLQGEFSLKIEQIAAEIKAIRVFIEAVLDFPDEEIGYLEEGKIARRLADLFAVISELISNARQGKLLNDGIKIALIGKPNVGKSSLLNALSGDDLAIVSAKAGTTRDIVRSKIVLAGMPVEILDTAGMRADTRDEIEMEGIKRSQKAANDADLLLVVLDATASAQEEEEFLSEIAVIIQNKEDKTVFIYNKQDLLSNANILENQDKLFISAKTGFGLKELENKVAELVGKQDEEAVFISRERHISALQKTLSEVENAACNLVNNQLEFTASDLYQAQDFLAEITGKVSTDELLDEIFSGFCIGK